MQSPFLPYLDDQLFQFLPKFYCPNFFLKFLPRTRRASPEPAAPHLHWQAARGQPHPSRLQHPEGVSPPPRPPPRRWRQEAQEEHLHQAGGD